MHLNKTTDGSCEKQKTAVTARYPSDDTTQEELVKLFGLSQITKGEDICTAVVQMLPALDCD
jgi:hypothetical protein